jgi:hypothetical protein
MVTSQSYLFGPFGWFDLLAWFDLPALPFEADDFESPGSADSVDSVGDGIDK